MSRGSGAESDGYLGAAVVLKAGGALDLAAQDPDQPDAERTRLFRVESGRQSLAIVLDDQFKAVAIASLQLYPHRAAGLPGEGVLEAIRDQFIRDQAQR